MTRNPRDLYSGLLFIGIGLLAVYSIWPLPAGDLRRMGPAFLPLSVSLILIVLGLAILARSFAIAGQALERFGIAPVCRVCAAIMVFGILISSGGLVVSSLALLGIVRLTSGARARLAETITYSVALTGASVVLFIVGLKMPMKIWPW